MVESQKRILIVDDEKPIRDVLSAALKDDGYLVETAFDGESGLEMMKNFKPQIVFLDIWMPGKIDGLDVLKKAKDLFPWQQTVIMSGHGTIETAVKAVKLGAWDFVEKPLSLDKVSILIQNIFMLLREQSEKQALLQRLRQNLALVGEGALMQTTKQIVARVAPTPSWILLSGESGTGKNLVAQNIHYMSHRASQPFLALNLSAVPQELMNGELFGYEKGSLVGSEYDKKGKLDFADGGTLYLDEVSQLTDECQHKLHQLLNEGSFSRVGGSSKVKVDVRIVASTTKNLEDEVKAGRFREDLYYRLNVVPFVLPPLRQRIEDLPALIDHFGDQFVQQGGFLRKEFSEQALQAMGDYDWPGNIRELRNFVERIYILTPGEFVDLHDVRFAGLGAGSDEPTAGVDGMNFRDARARFEREFLLKKIQENNGNISRTAEMIGLERSYLHRKIKSYGIEG